MAAGSAVASRFDEATAAVGLTPQQALVFEGQALMVGNNYIPSVAAWSFSGVLPGESSDLFDGDEGFYMARLDSLVEGGVQPLDDVRETIRLTLARKKVLARLVPVAGKLASSAVATTLEAAATEFGASAQPTPMFTRTTFVPGMGRDNEAIGAAFALAVGAVSTPVLTEDAVFVMRADNRTIASRDAWAAQRDAQRTVLLQSLQQERIQNYVRGLRDAAKVSDFRKEITRLGREADAALP
jgi:peptidyl-prolyl cis-trans isomerase D